MIRLTFAFNAIHLEAVRRLRTTLPAVGVGSDPLLDLLILERRRVQTRPADRRLWPLQLPVHPVVMTLLALLAWLGLVGEVRLAHLRNAGRALRMLVRRTPRLVLLDDGLDQYRDTPRALDPSRFAPNTPLALFSDLPEARASWCERFRIVELGLLYPAAPATPAVDPTPFPAEDGTLILDSPGVGRLMGSAWRLPRPWLLLPHPVEAKRSWTLAGGGDVGGSLPSSLPQPDSAEDLIARFGGTILVGESMTLLAALRLRPPGARLLIALPADCDPNLRRLSATAAVRSATVECL